MQKVTIISVKPIHIVLIISCILIISLLSSCIYYINPGHVGILVYKIPPAGNTRGILETPLNPGYGFRNPLTQYVIEYPTYIQTIILCRTSVEGSHENEEINVNSVEGQPVSCDVSLSFELSPEKVPELYVTFRQPVYDITHGFVKQSIRQAMQEVVGKMKIEDFLGKKKAEVIISVESLLQERLDGYGLIVKQFTINEIRASKSITSAIEQKNATVQEALKAQNELQKKKFEADQKIAEAEGDAKAILTRGKAQAKANELLSGSINPALIKYEAVKKWDGNLPKVSNDKNP